MYIDGRIEENSIRFWNKTRGRFRSLLNGVTLKIPFTKPNFLSSRNNEMRMNQSTLTITSSIRVYIPSTPVSVFKEKKDSPYLLKISALTENSEEYRSVLDKNPKIKVQFPYDYFLYSYIAISHLKIRENKFSSYIY